MTKKLAITCLALWAAAGVAAGGVRFGGRKPKPGKEESKSGRYPVPYVMRTANVVGEAEDEVAHFTADVAISVLREGWTEVPLLPHYAAIGSMSVQSGDAKKVLLLARGYGSKLLVGATGEYEVQLKYSLPLSGKGAKRTITLPFLQAVSSVLTVRVKERVVEFEGIEGLNLEKKDERDGTTSFTIFGAPATPVTISWTMTPRSEQLKTVAYAEQLAAIGASSGSMRVRSTIEYSVLQGQAKSFRVKLPAGSSLLSVEGEDLHTWDVKEEAGASVLVAVPAKPVNESYVLMLEAELPVETDGKAVPLPLFEVLDVEREGGTVGLSTRKGLKVKAASIRKPAYQIDVRDLPRELKPIIGKSFDIGMQYIRRPFEASVVISPAEARVSADVKTTFLLTRDSLSATTEVTYDIREAGVFRLQVRMPGFTVLNVAEASGNINTWNFEEDVLTVTLRAKAEASSKLTIEAELPKLIGPDRLAIPEVEVLGVEGRENGVLTLLPKEGYKVELVESKRLNQENLPESLRGVAGLAFRYSRHPYELTVRVDEMTPEIAVTIEQAVFVYDKELRQEIEVKLDIQKAGIFELACRLGEGFGIIEDVLEVEAGAKIKRWSQSDDLRKLLVSLEQKVMGNITLSIKCKSLFTDQTGGAVNVADLARINIPRLDVENVKSVKTYVAIEPRTSISLRPDPEGVSKIYEALLPDLPATLLGRARATAVAFTTGRNDPWTIALKVEPVRPMVTAEDFALLDVGPVETRVVVRIDYNIENAPVSELVLQVPEGADNVSIKGEGAKPQEAVPGKPGFYRLPLQKKTSGKYSIVASFTLKLPSDRIIIWPGVRPAGAMQVSGFIGVTAPANVEVSAHGERRGTEPITSRDIPAKFLTGLDVPILLAFKHPEADHSLAFLTTAHESARGVRTVVKMCRLESLLSRDGQCRTRMSCFLRTRGDQHFDVKIPEDAKLISVGVMGKEAENFARTSEGVLKIPLRGAEGRDTFPVSVSYQENVSLKLSFWGVVGLDCPAMSAPVMQLGWRLMLPEGFDLVMDHGDMKRAESYAFASAWHQMGGGRSEGEFVSGGGRSYWFEKSVIDAQLSVTPGTVRSQYMKRNFIRLTYAILFVIVVLAIYFTRGVNWRKGLAVAVVTAVVFIALRTISEHAFVDHLAWMILLSWLAVIYFGIVGIRESRKGELPPEGGEGTPAGTPAPQPPKVEKPAPAEPKKEEESKAPEKAPEEVQREEKADEDKSKSESDKDQEG